MTRRLLGLSALVLLTALVHAPLAIADPAVDWSPDEWFYWSLTEGTDESPGMVLTNPTLVRDQGMQACQRMGAGIDPVTASDMLEVEGRYSWDVAADIVSAAKVHLCP
jgi:hypothetical protein